MSTEIDVIVLTKDCLSPCLRESLESIKRAADLANIIPRLIVVDKKSTNGTLDEVSRHEPMMPFIIHDDEGNRATSRQIGIEAVQSDLFAFVDSDVVLFDDWFVVMLAIFANDEEEKIGAVWGITASRGNIEAEYLDALHKVYRKSATELKVQYSKKRGLTHDTMLRKDAVRGIRIPPELHVLEDHYIRLHVEKLGYEWTRTDGPICFHERHERVEREAYLDAYYGSLMGVHSRGWRFKHGFLSIPKLLYLLVATRNRKLVTIEYRKEKAILKALLRLAKERILRCERKSYS